MCDFSISHGGQHDTVRHLKIKSFSVYPKICITNQMIVIKKVWVFLENSTLRQTFLTCEWEQMESRWAIQAQMCL